jgi:hypothetical protein
MGGYCEQKNDHVNDQLARKICYVDFAHLITSDANVCTVRGLLSLIQDCDILSLQNKTFGEGKLLLRNILFGGESGLSIGANIGLTLLRVFTGLSLAFAHGIGKIPPGEGLVERAATLGFPAP